MPLTWGKNVIVATASGAGFDPGTDSITITRAPGTVGNLQATSGKQQVTLSWDPVPDAISYNIYWSTERLVSKATGTLISDVTSPYTQTGLIDGQTYYYMVTSVRDGGESDPSSVAATPGWVVESLTPTAEGTATSIATDSAGKAHIHYSYIERTGVADIFHSYYVTNVTGAWSSLPVDQSSGPVGTLHANANIALDSQNTVHVSVVNSSGLTHAIYTSGAWVREVVDASAICNASLAFDADNKAHIVYFTPTGLRYATNRSGAWTSGVIPGFDFPPDCDRYFNSIYVALGMDTAGAAHIAYISFDQAFRYATNQGGSWALSSFSSPKLFTGLALAVDPTGAVHIVYGENTSYTLQHMNNMLGTWTAETISNGGYVPSLSLDAAGKAHVSYTAGGGVYYASNSSGTWKRNTIEPNDSSRGNTDLAVDSQGKAHLSYSLRESLQYATNK